MLIRRKGRCDAFAGNSVWSTSERLVVEILTIGAIQVHFLSFTLSEPPRHSSSSAVEFHLVSATSHHLAGDELLPNKEQMCFDLRSLYHMIASIISSSWFCCRGFRIVWNRSHLPSVWGHHLVLCSANTKWRRGTLLHILNSLRGMLFFILDYFHILLRYCYIVLVSAF